MNPLHNSLLGSSFPNINKLFSQSIFCKLKSPLRCLTSEKRRGQSILEINKGNCFQEIPLILVSSQSIFFTCLHVYVLFGPCNIKELVRLLILILKRERLIAKLMKNLIIMVLGFWLKVLAFFCIEKNLAILSCSLSRSHVWAAEGSLVEEIEMEMKMIWREKRLDVLNSDHFSKICVPQTHLVEYIYYPTSLAKKPNQKRHEY